MQRIESGNIGTEWRLRSKWSKRKSLKKRLPLIHKICFYKLQIVFVQYAKCICPNFTKGKLSKKSLPLIHKTEGSAGVIKGEVFVHSLQGAGQNTGQSCEQISLLCLSYLFWQIQSQNNENRFSRANMGQSCATHIISPSLQLNWSFYEFLWGVEGLVAQRHPCLCTGPLMHIAVSYANKVSWGFQWRW